MTVKNSQLLKLFEEGAKSGQNHTESIQIVDAERCTLLVGYDQSVYAVRLPEGHIVKFTGWVEEDVSTTTDRHINSIAADEKENCRPQIRDWGKGMIMTDGSETLKKLE